MGDRRAFPDFGQSRIRHHNSGHGADIQALRERQGPRRDELARMRAHDSSAENESILFGDDFDVAVRLALGLRAVVLGRRQAEQAHLLDEFAVVSLMAIGLLRWPYHEN